MHTDRIRCRHLVVDALLEGRQAELLRGDQAKLIGDHRRQRPKDARDQTRCGISFQNRDDAEAVHVLIAGLCQEPVGGRAERGVESQIPKRRQDPPVGTWT